MLVVFVSGPCRLRCQHTVPWLADQHLCSIHCPAAPSHRESHSGQTHCWLSSFQNPQFSQAGLYLNRCVVFFPSFRLLVLQQFSVFCVADMDSWADHSVQRCFLLRFCDSLQFFLRDLQPPHKPTGGGNTPDVTAALLPNMRCHNCDGPVTKVTKPKPKTTSRSLQQNKWTSMHSNAHPAQVLHLFWYKPIG